MSTFEGSPSSQSIPPASETGANTTPEQFLRPQDTVVSFETEKGSVYTYDDAGQTTRQKVVTGEQFVAQDVTVFVDLADYRAQRALQSAIRAGDSPELGIVKVIERQADGGDKAVTSLEEVEEPDLLYLATYRQGMETLYKPASLFPKIGLYVYDMRQVVDGGQSLVERHLGHKVVKISHRDSSTTSVS